ncbi:MAG TPA: hypothetical protein VKQ32_13280 [Polyangia bacterium]|nr:hypothetical protein [Polyangia bacterium]
MKGSSLFLVLALGAAGAVSCKKSAEGGGSGGGGTVSLALPGVGLTAQVPEGSKVDKATVGEGLTIEGPDLSVDIESPPNDVREKTLAEAKAKVAGKPSKDETLPDGWAIRYETHGIAGTVYWVASRRTINGKPVWCDTTGTSAEQQANALAVCKSLK